ncbi:MAG: SUF system Fe-S cluster assembly regulator [Proteobacteria bacterium]|nr:SUF system Fe-S cluster assembly regulator [Pseudomonadota bacterium]
MIRLNRLTDYAVVLMGELARAGEVVPAAVLAQRTAIPQPTVAKLLKVLAQAGLATAQRGSAGGYGLSRPAGQISVVDVLQAVEGPQSLTACVEGASDICEFERFCPMQGRWDKVNKVILAALASVTLADMATPPAGPFGPFGGEAGGPVPGGTLAAGGALDARAP